MLTGRSASTSTSTNAGTKFFSYLSLYDQRGVIGDVGTIVGYAFDLTNGERISPAGSSIVRRIGDVALLSLSCSDPSQYSAISLDGAVIGSYRSTVLGPPQSDVYFVLGPSHGVLNDVTAVDAKTQKELWRRSIEIYMKGPDEFIATADALLSIEGLSDPHAYSSRTGNELRSLAAHLLASTPVVDADGSMIFGFDPGTGVLAVDGATGETIWSLTTGLEWSLRGFMLWPPISYCRERFIVTTGSAITYYAPTG